MLPVPMFHNTHNLTIHVNLFLSGQYGIPKPWYFPFTSSYWCGTPVGSDAEPDPLKEMEDQKGKTNTQARKNTNRAKKSCMSSLRLCGGRVPGDASVGHESWRVYPKSGEGL